MQVRKFHLVDHADHIRKWLGQRAMPLTYIQDLPDLGWIVFEGSEAISAGFIRQMEGSMVMIDNFISNPLANPLSRNLALDLITEEIIEEAKRMGKSSLIAFTKDAHTLERSARHGFSCAPHAMIFLDL
jgi:hypothetical protein